MHLTERETNRLLLFAAAELARRRRARGQRLNAPEAIALVSDEVLEMAWDGLPLAEISERARRILTRDEIMEGVAALVPRIEVEGLFPSGTALIALDQPFGSASPSAPAGPGDVRWSQSAVVLNKGRATRDITVKNLGPGVVFVSSHYPFAQVNRQLAFDRRLAEGMRLDLPAGKTMKWEPNQVRKVRLVRLGGNGTAPMFWTEKK